MEYLEKNYPMIHIPIPWTKNLLTEFFQQFSADNSQFNIKRVRTISEIGVKAKKIINKDTFKDLKNEQTKWLKMFYIKDHAGQERTQDLIREETDQVFCKGCLIRLEYGSQICDVYKGGNPRGNFLFHDQRCKILRQLKECIRQFVFDNETMNDISYFDVQNEKRILQLFKMKEYVINVDKPQLFRPSDYVRKTGKHKNNDRGLSFRSVSQYSDVDYNEYKGRGLIQIGSIPENGSIHVSSSNTKKDFDYKHRLRISQIQVWKELKYILGDEDIKKFDYIPKLLLYSNMEIYGEPLWVFCVDKLETKDRVALWLVLKYIVSQLYTPVASCNIIIGGICR